MHKEVRNISEGDYGQFTQVVNAAFEGLNADKWLKNHIEQTDSEELYGVFANEKLIAGMRTFDFEMNFSSTPISIGGVGMVAVDMLHKKEKNAYKLMQYFLDQNKEKNTNIVMLNPFKVSFYKRMGFGLGTKSHQFYLTPGEFQNFNEKNHLVELTLDDRILMVDCYNRIFKNTHGMTKRYENERELNRPFNFGRVIGFKEDDQVKGYFVYEIIEKNVFIHEMFFETPKVIQEFSTFFHQQSDQIDKIIITSNDESILHMVNSPESSMDHHMVNAASSVDHKHMMNTSVGVMYRILNTIGLFEDLKQKDHQFKNVSLSLKVTITDEFYPSNDGTLTIQFEDGKIKMLNANHYDTEIKMDIAEFSSLVMGAIDFKTLSKWGLASISSDEYIDVVNELFLTEQPPVCTKAF